MFLARAASR